MYSILSVMSSNPPPEHTSTYPMIPPLHPALPAYSNSNSNNNNFISSAKNMVHGDSYLTSSVSLPITTATRKGSEPILDAILQQPRNSPSYLLGTSSVSRYPSTCPLPLSHTSLPLQIPSYNAICLLFSSKNPQHAIKLRLPFSVFLPRL